MEKIFNYLTTLIKNQPNFDQGKRQLVACIKEFFPGFNVKIIEEINLINLQSVFSKWIINLVSDEPHKKNIKALWFGLFDAIYGDFETVELYITGSSMTPDEDIYDWPCVTDDSYWPDNRYARFNLFYYISNIIQDMDFDIYELKTVIFCSLTFLIIINGINDVKDELLDGRQELFIGCGFDNMYFYMYGKLTGEGLTDLKEQDCSM